MAEPLLVEAGERHEVHIELTEGARLYATAFVLGVGEASTGADAAGSAGVSGGSASLSLTVDLTGEGAEFHLHALSVASGGVSGRAGEAGEAGGSGSRAVAGSAAGEAAIAVTVNHLVPGCVSRQLIKGIAADSATSSFNGLVHVAPGAAKTDAIQRSQNLQLSDSAHINTNPQLEIYADDVACSHGATVGQLDEEAIYYMRQRGISESEARRMQLQGFANEIVSYVATGPSHDRIASRISTLIDGFN